MKNSLFVYCALLLLGCSQQTWVKPNATHADFESARFACLRGSQTGKSYWFGTYYRASHANFAEGTFGQCMRARGYALHSDTAALEAVEDPAIAYRVTREHLRQIAQEALTNYDSLEIRPAGTICATDGGVAYWQESPFVSAVNPEFVKVDIRPGDQLLAINGVVVLGSWDRGREILRYEQGQSITSSFERAGRRFDVKRLCTRDARSHMNDLHGLLDAIRREDWQQCIRLNRRVTAFSNITDAAGASIAMACNEAERLQNRRSLNDSAARLVYEAQRLRIGEAASVPGTLYSIRAHIIGTINWLDRNGFSYLATDLRKQLATRKQLSARMKLSPGRYNILVEAPGYETARAWVDLVPGNNEVWVKVARR